MANIAKIKEYCIANGEGLRTAVFFSGCRHMCEDCFNQELWDYNYGELYDEKMEKKIFNTFNSHIQGISILGGEPLDNENFLAARVLVKKFKEKYPDKDVWLWTGYTYEELVDSGKEGIFSYIDIMIDGRYEKSLYDYNLKWRGSSNQRVIDMKKTLAKGEICLYCD